MKYVTNNNMNNVNFNNIHNSYVYGQFNNNSIWKSIMGKNQAIMFIGD